MKKLMLLIIPMILMSCQNDESDDISNDNHNPTSQTFVQLYANTVNEITDMYFLDDNRGVLSGAFGEYSRTQDGGKTWLSLDVGVDYSFLSAFMLDACTLYTGRVGLYKSIDSGLTFMETGNLSDYSDSIFFIHFSDANNGIVNKGPVMLRTTNGGLNWEVTFSDVLALNRLQMVTNSIGFASGGATFDGFSEGIMLRTTNGGQTWVKLPLDSPQIMATNFLSQNIGFYVDFIGGIYRTSDGGDNWTQVTVIEGILPTGVCFVTAELGYLTTFDGKILKTEDGGSSWTTIYNASNVSLTNIERYQNTVFAYGNEGLILKLDIQY